MKMRKKSLFITTLAMVVLLIAALSTATFAWFTAQNTASVSGASIGTASSDAANIVLGWSGGTEGSSLTFGGVAEIRPMVPKTDPSESAGSSSVTLDFNEGIVGMVDNELVFMSSDSATPWTQKSADLEAKTGLYIKNAFEQPGYYSEITVKLTNINANFDGDEPEGVEPDYNATTLTNAKGMLRVAIFIQDRVDNESNYTYIGTLNTGGKYGVIPDGATGEEGQETYTVAGTFGTAITDGGASGDTFKTFKAESMKETDIKIFAWLEGGLYTTRYTGITVTFDLSFSAGTQTEIL